MKKYFIVFLLLLIFISTARGEIDYDIDTKIFIPPAYYVGDEVELRIKLKLFQEPFEIIVPEQLPAEEWIEVTSVHYIIFPRDVVTINIYFNTFKPGKHILPALALGDIMLEGIEIQTRSVTEELGIKKIKPKRGQVELPGTRLKIALLIIAVFTLPVLAVFVFRYTVRTVNRIRKSRLTEIPRNRIKRALKRLVKWIRKIDSKEFYIHLSHITRDYLEKKFLIPALTLTTRELTLFFNTGIEENLLKSRISGFAPVLKYADGIKFSDRQSTEEEKLANVNEILRIVNLIEEGQTSVES